MKLIVDMFPMTAVVAMFPSTYVSNSIATTHCEAVTLLTKIQGNQK
ncbi:MAG: hypothetical protein IKK48_01955 [Firmicutes bacterium]|nr:hypothetical protein [Bacillota bacterium]